MVICCGFQKNALNSDYIQIFFMILYMWRQEQITSMRYILSNTEIFDHSVTFRITASNSDLI